MLDKIALDTIIDEDTEIARETIIPARGDFYSTDTCEVCGQRLGDKIMYVHTRTYNRELVDFVFGHRHCLVANR